MGLVITVCAMIAFVVSPDVEAEDFGYEGAEMAMEVNDMELRVPSWNHNWNSNPFGAGTQFDGQAFVINNRP